MTYQETLDWMFRQLPMYQNKGKSAYKKDLSNTILLAKHLNNPENKFKSIHVGGTNGKGSTSHMLASVLQEAGYKVGLYTSPHLKDFRERIKINGKPVSKQFVIGFIKKHRTFFQSNQLSFFEMTVGMAFDYFFKKAVDIAIIEVGLGGRLDSTNIIKPEVSIITNIGLDHQQFLGNTHQQIAKEKAGIIKPNTPIVIGETQKETKSIFLDIANSKNAAIIFADNKTLKLYSSDLKGNYQKRNIKTAVTAIGQLKDFKILESHIEKGLNRVVNNTGLLGRWQVLQHNPKIVCDTAHNREGFRYIIDQIKSESFDKLHIVFGTVKDKDLKPLLKLLPKKANYYLCKPNISRALDVEELYEEFNSNGFSAMIYNSVFKACEAAKLKANTTDFIYIGGSTFVVAEIL